MLSPQFVEVFRTATSTLGGGIPTGTPTAVPAIPTVMPNRPTFERAEDAGKTTLWVVFVLMLLSTLVLSYLSWKTPVQKRLFHIITTFITAFATLSYFAMATGSGVSYTHFVIRETHKHVPTTYEHVFRQVYWARYVDWSITTPLLLLDLSFLAGISGANILVAIVADLVMILTGLFAALVEKNSVKWGWYAMACLAYLVILYILIIPGRRSASTVSSSTYKLFTAIGTFTIVLWTMYPIVWGVADGARLVSVDAEIMAYAVLDVLAKAVFGFWLLFAHGRKVENLGGFWSSGLVGEGQVRLDEEES